MELTEKEKHLTLAGFINGYEWGHNDTVESCYTDAEERAKDWLDDIECGDVLHDTIEQIKAGE